MRRGSAGAEVSTLRCGCRVQRGVAARVGPFGREVPWAWPVRNASMRVGVCGGGVVSAVAKHAADLLLGGGDPGPRSGGERDGCRRLVDAGGGAAAGLCLGLWG